MALLQCNFKSEVLGMDQPLHIILPQVGMADEDTQKRVRERGFPVLYLLHGLSDDHTVWMRQTSIERYAREYGLVVVMPNVNRSFYVDMKVGLNYYTYVTKEVPHIVRTYFPVSKRREDNFIAGLSMGGYGAFMIALRNPDMFSAAASLSGVVDLTPVFYYDDPQVAPMVKMLFGSKLEYLKSDYNLIRLLKKQKEKGVELPRLFQCCGTEDFLYGINQRFKAAAIKHGVDLTYQEGPGTHEWGYWDANIQKVLKWLFNKPQF